VELAVLKATVGPMQEKYAFSVRRACGLMLLAVSTYRYRPRRDDSRLRERLLELARAKPRYGSPRLHALLRGEGRVNHKRGNTGKYGDRRNIPQFNRTYQSR
jgi:hypothetical protein